MQTGCFPVLRIQCIINDVKVKEKYLVLKSLDVGNTHSDILDLLKPFCITILITKFYVRCICPLHGVITWCISNILKN